MSTVIRLANSWRGFAAVKKLVIFGDSYSDVGCELEKEDPVPDDLDPLGVRFPGTTWNEPNKPNWVGHLITKYAPPPRYNPEFDQQAEEYHANPLLVYDYAVGGDEVSGVVSQIQRRFLPDGKQPLWNAEESLFVTWVGINDCADWSPEYDVKIGSLLEVQNTLYGCGARNFCFIDVPPIHRSPAIIADNEGMYSIKYSRWNLALSKGIKAFSSEHEDATVLLFSSWDTFTKLLDSPEQYGFPEGDKRKYGGSMWCDHLHPTSAVHDWIAKDFAEFLSTVTASE